MTKKDTRTHADRKVDKARLRNRQKLAYACVKQEAARMGQTVDEFLELNMPEAAKES